MMKKVILFIVLTALMLTAASVMAQDPVRVKCGQIVLNVPSDNVQCYQIDGNIQVSDTASPEDIAAAQTACTAVYFSDYAFMNPDIPPQVILYKVDDLGSTSFELLDITMDLSDIVNNITTGFSSAENMYQMTPFLPYQTEERQAIILPKQLDFEKGTGIRTVTVFEDQIRASFDNSNLYYSYQGLSMDGIWYISAVFPLASADLDYQETSSVDWSKVTGADFQPSLEELDYYVRSIVIE